MLALWVLWAVLTIIVGSLALARKFVARNEDDFVHLSVGADQAIGRQTSLAERLEKIDQWGKSLTVIAGLFGLVLVAIMLFTAWRESLVAGN